MGFGGFAAGLGVLAPVAAIANGAADIWSANEDRKAQRDANNANIASAREANQWQEKMSNTAYQRAMEDMGKAGLNPMLAFSQGGASTPSAQTAVSQAASKGGMGRAVSKNIEGGIQNAFASQKLNNETSSTNSTVQLQAQQANTAKSQSRLNQAQAKLSEKNAVKAEAETKATTERNLRESDRWAIDKELKKIDRKYAEADKIANYVEKGAGVIADFMSPWKGMYRRQKHSDYPTGTSAKKQHQYEKGGYGSGYYDETYNPGGEIPAPKK